MMPEKCLTISDLKAKGVGIFNGEPMGLHYNREQKRRYLKEHKHDRYASHCAFCNGRTATVTDDYGDYICELCGIIKKEGLKTVEIKPF